MNKLTLFFVMVISWICAMCVIICSMVGLLTGAHPVLLAVILLAAGYIAADKLDKLPD